MSINVKLSKVQGGSQVRTDTVYGSTNALPEVGRSFQIVGPPVGPIPDGMFGFREVTTSIVQYIERDGEAYIVHTLNSVYRVEVL